jgi:GNAT superfamily N-acetyltransferase
MSVHAVPDLDLRLRPFAGEADIPHLVRIANADAEADSVPSRRSEADMLAWARHPTESSDPARDVIVAEIDGQPIGYAEKGWVDNSDNESREYWVGGALLPEWRRRGIGTILLIEAEKQARELAASHRTERRQILGSWSSDRQDGRVVLLRKHAYQPARYFFEMTRALSEPISPAALPDGLEIRPLTAETIRQAWAAISEAFMDHWGGFDTSDQELQQWMSNPNFDLSLWLVAWDGDEIAGGVANQINREENEALGVQRGWLETVFTRRPWRKRGLANALIARSLMALRDRGLEFGVLGVDADNPTGALGVYERNGFKVAERSTAWRKPLEA